MPQWVIIMQAAIAALQVLTPIIEQIIAAFKAANPSSDPAPMEMMLSEHLAKVAGMKALVNTEAGRLGLSKPY